MGRGVGFFFSFPLLTHSHTQSNAVQRNCLQPGTRSYFVHHQTELTLLQHVVGSFACIGGGLFGMDISSMSAVLNVRICLPFTSNHLLTPHTKNDAYFETFHHPGATAQGAIVAAMPGGSFVGALAV